MIQGQSPPVEGKFFLLPVSMFCLQLSFFAYSPLRPSLDALSHCKQKTPTVSKKTKSVSKKAPTLSKKLKLSIVSKELHCKQEASNCKLAPRKNLLLGPCLPAGTGISGPKEEKKIEKNIGFGLSQKMGKLAKKERKMPPKTHFWAIFLQFFSVFFANILCGELAFFLSFSYFGPEARNPRSSRVQGRFWHFFPAS